VNPGWTARRTFWGALLRLKFSATAPLRVPEPSDDSWPISPVPFADRYPDIPIAGLYVADHAPPDETRLEVRLFCAFQARLARGFSPMQSGLAPVDADPYAALATAYPAANRRLYRAPVRPHGYDPLDLGRIAVASPYFCYLEHDDSRPGCYRWNLRDLIKHECQPGVRSPWAVVEFEPDEAGDALRATRIESDLGTFGPCDGEWAAAQRLAMCAVSTHATLVRHFNWLHLVCGASLAIATDNFLPAVHPVRRLLRPHLYATHFGNEIVTRIAMEPGGDFENIFSFTHDGMCELFADTAGRFDLEVIHPERDAARRGLKAVPFGTPALDNRLELWNVIHDHVERYLAAYFSRDQDLQRDLPLMRWLDALTAMLPAGVEELAQSPATTDGAVELLSTFIYMTTVEHEILDSNVYDYQLWSDVQPARVYASGVSAPLDVYQRLVDYNFILSVNRTSLMSDFSALALDKNGQDAFMQFRKDLGTLQSQMSRQPNEVWCIEPQNLKANMNY
jgi:Lipoxygenase